MRSGVTAFLWMRLGRWLEGQQLQSLAVRCFRNAADGSGTAAADAAFLVARHLLGDDQNREAAETCEAALRHSPGHARCWCSLGAARRALAEMEAARAAYERALELDPDYAQASSNLGEWWLTRGEAGRALPLIERALRLDPDLIEAINNRIAVLYELGRMADAESAARQAIERHPDIAALHVNLGNVLLHNGKSRDAGKAFRRALECDPLCPEAHMNLATILGETHHLIEALDFIEHQIAAKGESAQRLASLALAQQARGDLFAAAATCEKVLEMQPANISALFTLSSCIASRAEAGRSIELLERLIAAQPEMPAAYSNAAFLSTYLPELSDAAVFEAHRRYGSRFGEAPTPGFEHGQSREPERRLRIGYVSGDFSQHPVGFLLRDVMRHHDPQQVEVHCFSMMRGSDAITEAIRQHAAAWHDILFEGDDEVARLIHEAQIDILVDLSGHTAYNRLPVFVRRPAPVQATWIGYFHSTGLSSIDYFITDPYTSPPGSGQHFSETPVCLPHSRFCYSPPDYAPAVLPPPSTAGGGIRFGCFNRVDKLVDPVLDAWIEILSALPESRLLLKSGALQHERSRDYQREHFLRRGLAAERLDLRGPSPHPQMLAEYGEVDIALDPFPFNGGMTSLEALWMGVPVVTLAGRGVVSRQTVSALANLGLADDQAFADVGAYVRGAVDLARDPARLAALRGQLRPRMAASMLCRANQFTRDLESLYRRMWRAWCEGGRLAGDL